MKVVLISSITPSGHYSQYLTEGLSKQKDIQLITYVGKHEKTQQLRDNGTIRKVWTKNIFFIYHILRQLRKDRPQIVHIQQEFNMYGGILTAILFPILVLLIRMGNVKTVVTIHAAVYKKQVTKQFMWLFNAKPYMKPVLLRLFFHYIYICTSLFADVLVVHTKRKAKILSSDYSVSPNKIALISVIIPLRKHIKTKIIKPYFFYFGYMVRRKGIEELLKGFKEFIAAHPKSSYRLVMAGGTIRGQESAKDEIHNLIHTLRIEDRVNILGFIEEAQQHQLYQQATAVVIPSLVSFGYSGPLYHAFSYHKSVITSDEGYFKEIIADGQNGILVKNNNWAQSLDRVSRSTKLRRKIESNVARYASLKTPNQVAKQYLNLYKSL